MAQSQLPENELTIVRWARATIEDAGTSLQIPHDERPVSMRSTAATGVDLVSNGAIGADIIRLPAGAGFPPHTHRGHHVLAILGGCGTITYNGRVHPTEAGEIYLVEGSIPHAVGAISDHVILAVGAPHMPVDADGRMEIVDYGEVFSQIGDLTCVVCGLGSQLPNYLHDAGCTHCPCHDCATHFAQVPVESL